MSRFFKRVFLPIFLGYSLLFALAEYFFFQYGYISKAKWMGRLLLLAQIPAFPLTHPFNSLILGKIFGFRVNYTPYLETTFFRQGEGFLNLANDLVWIFLSTVTYIIYYFLWKAVLRRVTRRIFGIVITTLFLLSYLALITSGLSKYEELRRRGWWETCPVVVDRSSSIYEELPDLSQVRHDICVWLRQTAPDLIIRGLGMFVGLLIVLKVRLFHGKSLIDLLKAKWLVLAWLALIPIWILPERFFSFPVGFSTIAIYSIPFLLPISWHVALKDLPRSLRSNLTFAVLSLLTLIYLFAIALMAAYRPMYY